MATPSRLHRATTLLAATALLCLLLSPIPAEARKKPNKKEKLALRDTKLAEIIRDEAANTTKAWLKPALEAAMVAAGSNMGEQGASRGVPPSLPHSLTHSLTPLLSHCVLSPPVATPHMSPPASLSVLPAAWPLAPLCLPWHLAVLPPNAPLALHIPAATSVPLSVNTTLTGAQVMEVLKAFGWTGITAASQVPVLASSSTAGGGPDGVTPSGKRGLWFPRVA
jgi:hypothetical protein